MSACFLQVGHAPGSVARSPGPSYLIIFAGSDNPRETAIKVTINGESFDYDPSKQPMSEALAIEHVYKRRYAEWQEDLTAGSAKAICVLAWLIWRRDGRDVPFEDILSGTADFDLAEMMTSMAEAAAAEAKAAEAEAAEPDPTSPGLPGPAGTATTGTVTSGSSRSTSGSGRGKSRG